MGLGGGGGGGVYWEIMFTLTFYIDKGRVNSRESTLINIIMYNIMALLWVLCT